MRGCSGCILLLLLIGLAAPAGAHELHHRVTQADAVVVELYHTDQIRFSYETYEIYHEDEEVPFETGRTDQNGRLAFLPDRAGSWRIKAFSADGHGVDFRIDVDAAMGIPAAGSPFYQRYGRILFGVGILFGIFGLLSLFLGRRRT